MGTSRLAAVQAEPVWLDLAGTVAKTIALIEEAAAGGAQLVAFPEVWLPGYPMYLVTATATEEIPLIARYRSQALAVDSAEMMRLRVAAADNAIIVALGFVERVASSLYMAQAVIDERGEIVLHRRKLKPTHTERTVFGQGDGSDLQVVQTSVGRVGALNCAENLQPLSKFALIAQDEQIRISAWPVLDCFGGAIMSGEAIVALNRGNAMEASQYVVVSTQVLSPQGAAALRADGVAVPEFAGGGYARIFGPDTTLLSDVLPSDREGIVYADIDLAVIDVANHFYDPVGHYARPDVFDVRIDRRRKPAFREILGEPSELVYPPLERDDAGLAGAGSGRDAVRRGDTRERR